jgi:hypothetical protein
MDLESFSQENVPQNEIQLLFDYAEAIEQKFSSGRAAYITPEWLYHIIQLSLSLRGKTSSRDLLSHLDKIENSAYAAILNYKDRPGRSEYFAELRTLMGLLGGLSVFI